MRIIFFSHSILMASEGTDTATEKKIYFFDDNNENRPTDAERSEGIKWIKIPQGDQTEDPNEHYLPHASHAAWQQYAPHRQRRAERKLVSQMKKLIQMRLSRRELEHRGWDIMVPAMALAGPVPKTGRDEFHKASGLKGAYLDLLMRDLQADKVSAIVLDWDRTVLIMEGMVTSKKKNAGFGFAFGVL